MLQERLGRKQVLIHAHMESLSKLHSRTNDGHQLRQFYDSYDSNIRALERLDVEADSYGSLLIPILLKKIPDTLRSIIFRANPDADCSLGKL